VFQDHVLKEQGRREGFIFTQEPGRKESLVIIGEREKRLKLTS